MPAVLNLSNEVVKLRAEVKRVKVLLIRKLIRQISALEKKKGSSADLERHRRRAARLREEIQELKVIVPDKVTKAALQKDISFEKVCRNKEASLSERAIARIATHPQFSKKIQSIKEAIKAFKEERINTKKAEKQAKNNAEDITLPNQPQEASNDDKGLEILHDDVEEKPNEEEGDKIIDKPREETCGSSQVSQMTSLETSNEKTNLCSKTQMSTIQEKVPEEVVRMRKEVKRTRVLVISKLTQQVAALKKKKDEESEMKERQELIAELMKDIQGLRSLKPDQLTVTALQENSELEKVLLDPQTSPLDRAIARIVTHTRFIKKLQKVKEAIEKERAKAAAAEQRKIDRQNALQSKNKSEEVEGDKEDDAKEKEDKDDNEEDEEEDDNDEDEENDYDNEEDDDNEDEDDGEGKDKLDSSSINTHKSVESDSTAANAVKLQPVKEITISEQSGAAKVKSQNADTTTSKGSSEKSLVVCRTESRLPKGIAKPDKKPENTIKPQNKHDLPENKQLQSKEEEEESDLSDDDDEEEKEYFDDSTEERFHKQSSHSEESDDDDFFVGKVSKFKKRKAGQAKVEGSKTQKPDKSQDVEKVAHEPNLGKLQSVFCSTLSKSSVNSQNTKPGSRRDRSRHPRFQNQKKGPGGRMKTAPCKDPGTDRKAEPFNLNKQTFKFAGQRQGAHPGAGKGKSQFEQHQNSRGPSVKISNPPQQSLHPSWEASRKRKEQQAQITVFQGKKIKFDDD
nr:serum response factor-binding protein 1 [Misgurnus anguillicaudatus]